MMLAGRSFGIPAASSACGGGAAPPPDDAALPPGWVEAADEDGRPFYFHEATQESRWARPTYPLVQPPGRPSAAERQIGYA